LLSSGTSLGVVRGQDSRGAGGSQRETRCSLSKQQQLSGSVGVDVGLGPAKSSTPTLLTTTSTALVSSNEEEVCRSPGRLLPGSAVVVGGGVVALGSLSGRRPGRVNRRAGGGESHARGVRQGTRGDSDYAGKQRGCVRACEHMHLWEVKTCLTCACLPLPLQCFRTQDSVMATTVILCILSSQHFSLRCPKN